VFSLEGRKGINMFGNSQNFDTIKEEPVNNQIHKSEAWLLDKDTGPTKIKFQDKPNHMKDTNNTSKPEKVDQ
jgi:hypothetical protein